MKTQLTRLVVAIWVPTLLLTACARSIPPSPLSPPVDQRAATGAVPHLVSAPVAQPTPAASTGAEQAGDEPSTPIAVAPAPTNPAPQDVTTVLPAPARDAPQALAAKEGDQPLYLNFRGAPIDAVLNYLSDAAGFIIQMNTSVTGRVDVWSSAPVSKAEAVDLLISELNKNGYTAIRNERKLTIMSKDEAMHGDIPVKSGNDASAIPKNDEIVTQIIPVNYVEAPQLAKDLAPLVSPHATLIANEAGNSIAITDTQSNIRHLVEIISAIDSNAETVTELRVFHLAHADATETAALLTSLFSGQGDANAQLPLQFGGPMGRYLNMRFGGQGGPNRPGGGDADHAPQSQRIRKREQVAAVADPRTSSVVVTATKDVMNQIAGMIQDLDFQSSKETTVQIFHLENADPQEVLPILQDMFQIDNPSRSGRSSGSQTSPLMSRSQQNQGSAITQGTTIGSGLGGAGRTAGQGVSF